MCGIVGYTGGRKAAPIVLDGLRRLEYRGYDSAGIASFEKGGIGIVRAVGKLVNLDERLKGAPLAGTAAIGHTRWATHGRPSEVNAHPHKAGKIVVVHNGIIENYSKLKASLIKKGARFASETDTEVIAHLLDHLMTGRETMRGALLKAVRQLEGTFAIAVLNADEPGTIYLAKKESPLVLGVGKGEQYFASDIPALLAYTREIVYLRDGDIAELRPGGYSVYNFDGTKIDRKPETVTISLSQAEKGGYPHFMLKEIHEQPEAFVNTIRTRIEPGTADVLFEELPSRFFGSVDAVHIIACGTSYHAGMVGRCYFEEIAGLPTAVEIASEFRYKRSFFRKRTLYLFISQSGATADTLAALKLCRENGVPTLAVTNVIGSSISQEAERTVYTHAGPEIGVASTKAFTTQVAILLALALRFARVRNAMPEQQLAAIVEDMLKVPSAMEAVLRQDDQIKALARRHYTSRDFLYLGRGLGFPLALEGALKLKEISYIHAEAYAAGEMKHGPIALIDEQMPVFVIATKSPQYDKTLSNMQEVLARGGKVIALASAGDRKIGTHTDDVIRIPHLGPYLDPLVATLPLQLFAYYCAVLKGTDVDQPRNLAKSVTVE